MLCVGSTDACARLITESRSCLLSRLATGFATTGAGVAASLRLMLSRDRMLVTAAPVTRKQVSAMMVIAFDKPFSVGVALACQFPQNWELIKA